MYLYPKTGTYFYFLPDTRRFLTIKYIIHKLNFYIRSIDDIHPVTYIVVKNNNRFVLESTKVLGQGSRKTVYPSASSWTYYEKDGRTDGRLFKSIASMFYIIFYKLKFKKK